MRKNGLDLRVMLSLLALVIVAGVVALLTIGNSSGAKAQRAKALAEHFDAAAVLEPPTPAPPISLHNYLGQPVNIAGYRGKAVLVTFLYTTCPDICPLITSDLRVAQNLMSPATRSKLQIIAVSVDPRVDTRESVAAFLARHGMTGRMLYLTGTAKELAPVWKAWSVGTSQDLEQPQFINHTGIVYGITASGKRLTRVLARIQAGGNRARRAPAGRRRLNAQAMGARRMRVLGVTLALLAAAVALAVFGLASSQSPAGGRLAPGLPRERLSGAPVTLASLLAGAGGRPALVVFWASWCGPCAEEAPALERFYRSAAGRGRLVGVDWSDPLSADARSFVRRYGWTFPVLRDAGRQGGQRLRAGHRPAGHVRDRPRRSHPRGAAGPAERRLAAGGAGAGGTELAMAGWEDVRRIALALPQASERSSRGLAQWRVSEKLFVWERPLRAGEAKALGEAAPDGPILGARVEHLGAKEALLADDPQVYFTTSHFDGYPAVLVRLERIDVDELEELVVEAWLCRAPKTIAQRYLDEHQLG